MKIFAIEVANLLILTLKVLFILKPNRIMDPISIVAAISFAFQCGTLLRSAFDKSKVKWKNLQGFDERIERYKMKLDSCKLTIGDWCMVWGFSTNTDTLRPKKFPEEILMIFWGSDTYERIVVIHDKIRSRLEDITNHLKGKGSGTEGRRGRWRLRRKAPSSPNVKEWEQWQRLVQQPESERKEDFYKRNASLFEKICFALFENDELSMKVENVEEQLNELRKFMRIYFNKLKGRSIEERVGRKETEESYDSLQAVKAFSAFAHNLYDIRSKERGNWSLELRVPDQKHSNASNWNSSHPINLDFTVHVHSNLAEMHRQQPGCRRFRLCYTPGKVEELKAHLQRLIKGWLISDLELDQTLLKPLDSHCKRLSRPVRSLFLDQSFKRSYIAKAWSHDRARLLFAFANWMVLLFNTPWIDHACCCQIRFEIIGDGIEYVLSGMETPCSHTLSRSEKLPMIGLVLSEIILMKPFSLDDLPEASLSRSSRMSERKLTQFILCENGKVKVEQIDRDSMLAEIVNETNETVRDAVQFCLQGEILDDTERCQGELALTLRRNVLTPIYKYFQEIEKDRVEYARTEYSELRKAKYGWPPRASYDHAEDCRLRTLTQRTSKGEIGDSQFFRWISFQFNTNLFVLVILLILALANIIIVITTMYYTLYNQVSSKGVLAF